MRKKLRSRQNHRWHVKHSTYIHAQSKISNRLVETSSSERLKHIALAWISDGTLAYCRIRNDHDSLCSSIVYGSATEVISDAGGLLVSLNDRTTTVTEHRWHQCSAVVIACAGCVDEEPNGECQSIANNIVCRLVPDFMACHCRQFCGLCLTAANVSCIDVIAATVSPSGRPIVYIHHYYFKYSCGFFWNGNFHNLLLCVIM